MTTGLGIVRGTSKENRSTLQEYPNAQLDIRVPNEQNGARLSYRMLISTTASLETMMAAPMPVNAAPKTRNNVMAHCALYDGCQAGSLCCRKFESPGLLLLGGDGGAAAADIGGMGRCH